MKHSRLPVVWLCALVLLAPLLAAETALSGKVVKVTDGDTIAILTADRQQITIRLEGIDAPESHQDYGTKSKTALSGKVFGQQVTCQKTGEDRYGRTLATVFVGKRPINREMVSEGWAWHFVKYSSDEDLAAAQKAAQRDKRGLWAGPTPVPPWDFRNPSSTAQPATPVTADAAKSTTVYVTATGDKYHLENCRHLSKSKIPISLDRAKQHHQPCKTCKPPQ